MQIIKAKIRAVENVTTKKDGQPFAANQYTGLAQMIQRVTYTGEDGITRTANCFSPIEHPVFSVGNPESEITVVVTQTQKGTAVYNNIRLATEKDVANTAPNAVPQVNQPVAVANPAGVNPAPQQEVNGIGETVNLIAQAQAKAVTIQLESLSTLLTLNKKVDALIDFLISIANNNSHLVKDISIKGELEKIQSDMDNIKNDYLKSVEERGNVEKMKEEREVAEKMKSGEADIEPPDQYGAEENQTAVDNGDKDPFSDG